MMRLSLPFPQAAVCAGVAVLCFSTPSRVAAIDRYWDGSTNNNYAVGSNWSSNFVPEAGGGNNERGVIGTDSGLGLLNGAAVLSSTPVAAGGLALGLRERDPDTGQLVNQAPLAGTLIGSLTINTGTLTNVTTSQAAIGADGRVLVGVDGRGYLTMTGGRLNALGLVVAGENISTGNGTSQVDLSGSSIVNITGASGSLGLATFGRRLKVTGPGVDFNSQRTLTLQQSNTYTAVITSATDHSPLKTSANAVINGALSVEFTGAGATHPLGRTWNLVDATTAISGTFNNLGISGEVSNVSGLAAPTPFGAVYRVKKATNPDNNHTLLQLSYERTLVLQVNRDTGAMSINNPQSGSFTIDGYTISSPTAGSLLTTYKGISGAPAGDSNWAKYGLSANNLSELKQDGTRFGGLNLTSVPSLTLGNGFNKLAVANNIANFGNDGEDLTFQYTIPTTTGVQIFQGQVQYIGTKFENDLVLRVNPTSGRAFIKNDSLVSLNFDGYSILSSTNSLDGNTWTGLGGTWQKTTPPATDALSQTNLSGSTVLAPGASVDLGDIGAFTTTAAQAGLRFQFILAAGFTGGAGDLNGDGIVDGADVLVWQRGLGTTYTPADLATIQANFGTSGGSTPESTFRAGTVMFDNSVGLLIAAPEPGAGVITVIGVLIVTVLQVGQRRRQSRGLTDSAQEAPRLLGDRTMSRRRTVLLSAIVSASLALLAAPQAQAVTQGIPLTNFDFELPGPPGFKTIAFNSFGAPIPGIIPGWTFVGPGVETFGHPDQIGDSGTEGGGNPGNDMILSTLDGVVYQTATGFSIQSIPATQTYKFGFDAHDIFTITSTGAQVADRAELTARFYYGASRTTLTTLVVHPTGAYAHYELLIPGGSPLLTPAIGQSIGVEFDVTSIEYDVGGVFDVAKSWVGIDNVIMEIAGVMPGDLNGDGSLTAADFTNLRNNLQKARTAEADGELTGDNFVDLNDFRAFKTLLTAAVGPAQAAAILGIPEPSTAALAALLLAVSARSLRRRMCPGKQRGTHLSALAALSVLAVAAPASAVQLQYDAFRIGASPAAGEYTVGLLDPTEGPGDGQNPNTGSFFSGGWHRRSSGDAPNVNVQETGLSYLGSPALGGSTIATPNGRIARDLATPWDATTVGNFYISFVVNFGALPDDNKNGDMGYRTVEFRDLNGPFDLPENSANGYIGYNAYYHPNDLTQRNPNTGRMTFQFGGQYQVIEGSPLSFNQDGATHLVVLKFQLTADPVVNGVGGDTISVFLDPVINAEPDLPAASVTGVDFQLGTMSAATLYGSSGIFPQMDEIRVGTTYEDVLPIFPVPGDTNGDRLVDMVDFNNIVSHFNQQVSTTLEGDVAKADGSQGADGRVTLADFRIWRNNRTDIPALPDVAANFGIPEPSSLLLAALGALAAARRDRGRRPC